jgi:hypothetical protein
VNWGDGSTDTTDSGLTYATPSVTGLMHTYVAGGPYTIVVSVTDKDNGTGMTSSDPFSFLYNTSGILQPINPGPPNSIFKYGSTIPVKIQVTDCNNTPVSGLTLNIGIKKVLNNTPPGTTESVQSTSAADTGTMMRWTGSPDYQYIYNLATKVLCTDPTAAYTITISGTGIANVSATFGLKT